jgi:hypothetical protein
MYVYGGVCKMLGFCSFSRMGRKYWRFSFKSPPFVHTEKITTTLIFIKTGKNRQKP